jgi:hypothetical protein
MSIKVQSSKTLDWFHDAQGDKTPTPEDVSPDRSVKYSSKAEEESKGWFSSILQQSKSNPNSVKENLLKAAKVYR